VTDAPVEEVVDVESAAARVAHYREQVARNPHYAGELANALRTLGRQHSDAGDEPAALVATQEAVALHRDVAYGSGDSAKLVDLVVVLVDLDRRHSELGDPHAATSAMQEAVDILTALSEQKPGDDDYQARLASALNDLAADLAAIGEDEAAHNAADGAATWFRQLSTNDADEYRPDLALALRNLGERLAGIGDRAGARAAQEESVDLYRVLVTDDPDHRMGLAAALDYVGTRRAEASEFAGGLEAVREAVDIFRVLAGEDSAYLADLAEGLDNLGNRLAENGLPGEGLAAAREAVGLFRNLVWRQPNKRPEMATALVHLGRHLTPVDAEDALAVTREAVQIRRELAAGDHDAHQRGLAEALLAFAAVRHRLGVDLVDAGDAAEEAAGEFRTLAGRLPARFDESRADAERLVAALSEARANGTQR
jgi:tetratricopeptide (TPR) repeat protein